VSWRRPFITDKGQGIPSEALTYPFDRFYQVDPTRVGGATAAVRPGAELAMLQETVQAHNGKISIRRQVGHGTMFVIHLAVRQNNVKDGDLRLSL